MKRDPNHVTDRQMLATLRDYFRKRGERCTFDFPTQFRRGNVKGRNRA